jgi:cytochrome c biogenesis protein CcmG, thiol:disulfide interchange protein DsbE
MVYKRIAMAVSAFYMLVCAAAVMAQKAPVFDLPGNSNNISLKNLKGKVVYLDFWASWCTPCRNSFPWMNELQARYKNQDFTVVAVNLDSSHSEAERFLEKIPAKFVIAYDPEGTIASKYQLKVMPSSYLIDRKGNLSYVHKGYREGDTDAIETRIQKLINAR